MRNFSALSAAVSFFCLACNPGEVPQIGASLDGDPFVAIERHGAMTADEAVEAFNGLGVKQSTLLSADGPKNFYLAINKNELGNKWFLSAYMRDMFPGAVFGGAASSLDTKVVTFRIQNEKLFIVDADGRKAVSDLFDPDILIDAFPLVTDYAPFNVIPGSENYVLIDPTNGLNEFSVIGDMFGTGYGARVDVELSYLHNYRIIDDGVTYEHVFTGYTTEFDDAAWELWENPFRLSGTLGIGLRRYKESEAYEPTQMPLAPHYFEAPPILVPNTGNVERRAAKWAVKEGMEPIEWLISREVLTLAANPEYADYDIVGTIKKGIEEWNNAFGFKVLSARVAEPDEDMGQDDKNFFIIDLDPTAGFAFANWRNNPATGEIRGASVYLSAVFLEGAHNSEVDDVDVEPGGDGDPNARPRLSGMGWGPMATRPLCDMHVSDAMHALRRLAKDESVQLTKKEKVERILQQVVAHEIGHTLGLRHNFKGSLVPPSTSAMDYLVSTDSILRPGIGEYDISAIQYLYGINPDLPTQLFCTDGGVALDPYCERFDEGADPLVDSHMVLYDLVWGLLLDIGLDIPVWQNRTTNSVLGFVRAAPTEADRMRAWNLAIEKARTPLDPQILTNNPFYGAFADKLGRFVLNRLLLDPPELRGIFANNPPPDAALIADILGQVHGNLVNEDGVRSFDTRRSMVDILKANQTVQALTLLKQARAEIVFNAGFLVGPEKAIEDDLVQRIDAALSPYFN